MSRAVRSLLGLLAGFAAATVAVQIDLSTERIAVPGQVLGGIDLDAHCKRAYGDDAIAINPGAYQTGWRCAATRGGIFNTFEIDFDTACFEQYDQLAYADVADNNRLDAWRCFVGPRQTKPETSSASRVGGAGGQ
jgi:hypothetical protein